MYLRKIFVLAAALLMLSGCSAGTGLSGGRWYIDDRNNTVRTVATFEKETSILHVNYVLIDEGRAERTGVDGMQYVFDKYYYRDMGKNMNGDTEANADDERAFEIYSSEEDFKAKENAVTVFYHFEEDNLVVNGNVCLPLTGELARETDNIIAGNKAAIGE